MRVNKFLKIEKRTDIGWKKKKSMSCGISKTGHNQVKLYFNLRSTNYIYKKIDNFSDFNSKGKCIKSKENALEIENV